MHLLKKSKTRNLFRIICVRDYDPALYAADLRHAGLKADLRHAGLKADLRHAGLKDRQPRSIQATE